MSTVRDLMNKQKEALRNGDSTPAGPPVLLESAQSSEVLLPKGDTVQRKRTWSTKPFNLEEADAEAHKEVRIERMMALQELITDESEVIELVRGGQHSSTDICIGRAQRNDVVLDDDTISSVHASMEDTGAALLLLDRTSSNGTFVNQERLAPGSATPLASGDCLRFGKRVYYYLTGERLLLFLELRIVKDSTA